MNDMLKMGIILMVVTLIASLALALTNHYTAPQIDLQEKLAIKESLNKVIEADSFEGELGGYEYEAYDKDGNWIGTVLRFEVPGYSSTINTLLGIGPGNKITGIDIISQQETPGLGANIEKESFLQQFIGKTKDQLKLKKDGGEIDAVTGATISSRAITRAAIAITTGYDFDAFINLSKQNETDVITSDSPEWNNTNESKE